MIGPEGFECCLIDLTINGEQWVYVIVEEKAPQSILRKIKASITRSKKKVGCKIIVGHRADFKAFLDGRDQYFQGDQAPE